MTKNKILELVARGKEYHVLYVEDNESVRETTHSILSKLFTHLYVAIDGQDGLAQFNRHNMNIIITDINMPQMSGIEMIKEIRKVDNDVQIIVISAHNETGYLKEAESLGVKRYIYKPIDLNVLVERLLEVVEDLEKRPV